jgi:periplasmic protein CpxP/Spy
MNLKRIMPVILGASMALTPLMGLAQEDEGAGHGGMRGHRMHKLGRMLDLTDQQKQQLASARKSEQDRMKPYREQIAAAHKQIEADVASGNFNEEKARSLLAQSAQARTELELSHARMQAAMYNLLTPEQRTKLNERKQKREQRRMEHKQKLEQEKSGSAQ